MPGGAVEDLATVAKQTPQHKTALGQQGRGLPWFVTRTSKDLAMR